MDRHVRSRRRCNRQPSQGVEGSQSRTPVGEQARTPAGSAAGGGSSVVMGKNPSIDRRRHRRRLARSDRAARPAADSTPSHRAGGTADVEDARRQYSNSVAGREGAPAPSHHECLAFRAGGLGRDHGGGWQVLPDGGGRSGAHAGLDLARAHPSGDESLSSGWMRSTCPCTITWGRARSSPDRSHRCRKPSPMPPLRSPTWCRISTIRAEDIRPFSAIPMRRLRPRRHLLRPRATARGACATSIRSRAVPGWR